MVRSESTVRTQVIKTYFLFITILSLVVCFRIVAADRNWAMADWLINYQGGFVRRGLAGEFIFQLHRLTHLSFSVLVPLIVDVVQCCVLACWYWLAIRSSRRTWVVALIVSPATLAFWVLNFQDGVRKETVLLAGFSLLLVYLQRAHISDAKLAFWLGLILVVSELVHEISIFYLPYFLAALMISGRNFRRSLKTIAIPAILVLVAAGLSSRWKGSEQVAAQICTSVGYTLDHAPAHDVCDAGAIGYLRFSSEHALRDTVERIRTNHAVPVYALFAVLALAPIAAGSRRMLRTSLKPLVRLCWIAAVCSWVASIPLFLLGLDWGRWIHLHVMLLGGLLLALDARAIGEAPQPLPEPVNIGKWPRYGIPAMLVLYATAWMMPVVYVSQPLRGYWAVTRLVAASAGVHIPLRGHR